MKKIVLKKYNVLIAFLLSLLGFATSCEKGGGMIVEYGTPSATFKVLGIVINESDVPIEGVQVVMFPDSTLTDANGHYEVSIREFPGDQSFTVKYKDVDGTVNGEYIQKDSVVSFVNNQYQNGDGSWYDGIVSKEVNIKLKEQ